MPTIDLFNKTADEAKIAAAIVDGSFRFRSKLYAKYAAKSVAQTAIITTTATLALIGAAVVISSAIEVAKEETE